MDLIFFSRWCIVLARTFFQKRKGLQNRTVLEAPSPSEVFNVSNLANFWSGQAQKRHLHTKPLRGRFHNAMQPRGEAFSVSRFLRVQRRVFLFYSVQGTFFSRDPYPCTTRGIPHRRSSHEQHPFSVHTLYHNHQPTARKRCLDVFLSHSDLPSRMPSFTSHSKQKQRRMEGL